MSHASPGVRAVAWVLTCVVAMHVGGVVLRAQHPADHADPPPAAAPSSEWKWRVDNQVFFGFNDQERKFTDFSTWESQNWLMGSAERPVGPTLVRFSAMLSFEAATLKDIGSAQVFQTGETYKGAPLIDYQHPHDLFMGIGGEVSRRIGRATAVFGADIVGPPTIGPPVFMHRPSAAENPQAPLSHHHIDSTHITPGVLRGGLEMSGWEIEGSWFRGEEPDENRLDLDLGALDSWAVRLSFHRGPWDAQASAARLTKPERITPYDADKLTGSISYTSQGHGPRSIAWLWAFGQKREIHGNLEAYMFEATFRLSARDAFFTRAESVAKDILDAGYHPPGTFHRHRQSQVSAITVGYVRDIVRGRAGDLGVGGDATVYGVPANLEDAYGAPSSFHIFVRYRVSSGQATHIH